MSGDSTTWTLTRAEPTGTAFGFLDGTDADGNPTGGVTSDIPTYDPPPLHAQFLRQTIHAMGLGWAGAARILGMSTVEVSGLSRGSVLLPDAEWPQVYEMLASHGRARRWEVERLRAELAKPVAHPWEHHQGTSHREGATDAVAFVGDAGWHVLMNSNGEPMGPGAASGLETGAEGRAAADAALTAAGYRLEPGGGALYRDRCPCRDSGRPMPSLDECHAVGLCRESGLWPVGGAA